MAMSLPKGCCEALGKYLNPDLFKALCDPMRLILIARFANAREPIGVTEASHCCGVHLSGVSRHLSILRNAGVLDAEKRGREVFYRLNTRQLTQTLRGLADAIDDCCQTNHCCQPAEKKE